MHQHQRRVHRQQGPDTNLTSATVGIPFYIVLLCFTVLSTSWKGDSMVHDIILEHDRGSCGCLQNKDDGWIWNPQIKSNRWKFAKEVWYTFDLARVHHWISLSLITKALTRRTKATESWTVAGPPGPKNALAGVRWWQSHHPTKRDCGMHRYKSKETHELIWIDHQKTINNPSNNSHQSHQHKIQTTYRTHFDPHPRRHGARTTSIACG